MTDESKREALMRRFVSAAPPGQLRATMRSLRAVLRDDAFFFRTAPLLCAEHLADFGIPVVLPVGSISVSRATHAPEWGQRCTPPGTLQRLQAAHELSDDALRFTYIDWRRRVLCIVDPLTSAVVEDVPFHRLDAEKDPSLAALWRLTSAVSPMSDHTMLRTAALLTLRDALDEELCKYAARRYPNATTSVNVALDLAALAMQQRLAAPDAEQPPATVSGDPCPGASFSVPLLHCMMSSEKVSGTAYWSGRWVTRVTLRLSDVDRSFTSSPSRAGPVSSPSHVWANGSSNVAFAYHETGNIHMDSSRPISFTCATEPWVAEDSTHAERLIAAVASTLNGADTAPTERQALSIPTAYTAVARRLVRHIELAEDAHQESMNDAARGPALSDSAMRPLRRKLPVTRQLYDFGGRSAVSAVRGAFASRPGRVDNNDDTAITSAAEGTE